MPAAGDYPNKLFGGARFDFRSPLRIGDRIHKESEVLSFDLKEGRSGAFIVGLVQHRISNGGGIAVVEENDIIFRPASPRDDGRWIVAGTPASAACDHNTDRYAGPGADVSPFGVDV